MPKALEPRQIEAKLAGKKKKVWTPARIGGLAAACLVLIVGVMVYQNYFKMEDAARDDKIAGSDVTISDSTKVESAAEYKDVYAYLENIRKASHNTVMSYHSDLTKMIAYLHGQGMDSVSAVRTTHLNSYVLLLEKDGMAAATISRYIAR